MEALAVGETFLFECFRLDRRGLSQRDERGVFAPVAIGSRALDVAETFLFEAFRLDRRGLFCRDERGVFVPVAIGGRAFEVLRVLIAAYGDLVSKDEIMTAVWPGTAVEDNNLTVQIAALRRILDQGRTDGSCIQTVAGRGYGFCRASDAARGG